MRQSDDPGAPADVVVLVVGVLGRRCGLRLDRCGGLDAGDRAMSEKPECFGNYESDEFMPGYCLRGRCDLIESCESFQEWLSRTKERHTKLALSGLKWRIQQGELVPGED